MGDPGTPRCPRRIRLGQRSRRPRAARPADRRAIELIHRQPERRWTAGDVAAKVALSRSAFSARFRELAGESPRRYITRASLAPAAALLNATDGSLAQIATQAGYATEFSFSKAFKRTFGVAPGAYRGQRR